jgi:hypothetical protein
MASYVKEEKSESSGININNKLSLAFSESGGGGALSCRDMALTYVSRTQLASGEG